jgi:hypothetical protein
MAAMKMRASREEDELVNATAPLAMPNGKSGRTERRPDGPGRRRGPGHLDAKGAARALSMTRPKIAVPIHGGTPAPIGTHLRTRRCRHGPAVRFRRHTRQVAPAVGVRILGPVAVPELAETPRDVDGDGVPDFEEPEMAEPAPARPDLGSEPDA